MTEIITYRAFDGMDFGTKIGCLEHELKLFNEDGIIELYSDTFVKFPPSYDTLECGEVDFIMIREDSEEVRNFFDAVSEEGILVPNLDYHGKGLYVYDCCLEGWVYVKDQIENLRYQTTYLTNALMNLA